MARLLAKLIRSGLPHREGNSGPGVSVHYQQHVYFMSMSLLLGIDFDLITIITIFM